MKPDLKTLPIPGKAIFTTPDRPLVGTAQANLPIAEIVDDMVIFKDGGAAIVLETTSLNFGLLSEREQEAVIAAYASLINSLSFSIQIVVRTQRKDITRYMNYLSEASKRIKSPKLTGLFESYRNFVVETTRKRNVLGKRFFIVVPFSPFELGATTTFKSFATRSGPLPYTKDYVVKKAKVALGPKKDHVARQAARLGLRVRQLNREELTELYYDVYSPKIETVMAAKDPEDLKKRSADELMREEIAAGQATKESEQPIEQTQPVYNQINENVPSPEPVIASPERVWQSNQSKIASSRGSSQ